MCHELYEAHVFDLHLPKEAPSRGNRSPSHERRRYSATGKLIPPPRRALLLIYLRLVFYNITAVPSCAPSSPLLRPLLNTHPPSHLPTPTKPKPHTHNSPYTLHISHYIPLLPSLWQPCLLFRPPPLFPHLGPRDGKGGEDLTGNRSWRAAKEHGALQAEPLRTVDGSRWL